MKRAIESALKNLITQMNMMFHKKFFGIKELAEELE